MGMLTQPEVFADCFKEGETFTLQDAKIGSEVQTEYGAVSPVLLKINDQWYSIIGQGIFNQVQRLEPGELPARVAVTRRETRNGQEVKVIVPADELDEDKPQARAGRNADANRKRNGQRAHQQQQNLEDVDVPPF